MDRSNNSIYSFNPNAAGSGSFPDMSKATGNILPKANIYNEFKISPLKDGSYLVTNTSTNTPEFFVMSESIFNPGYKPVRYDAADSICSSFKIGEKSGWRLPNLFELEIIYGLRDKISLKANLTSSNYYYWSSTKSEIAPGDQVICIDFLNGNICEALKPLSNTKTDCYGHLFAVRDIKPVLYQDSYEIPLGGDSSIFIRRNDLKSSNVYFGDVNDLVNKYNNENNIIWRLPFIEELRFIYNNRNSLTRDLYSKYKVFNEGDKFYSIGKDENGKIIWTIKNMFSGQEDTYMSRYNPAHIKLVRSNLNTLYLDKYIGSFKSQHPSLDRIELIKSNDLLLLKLFHDSTSTDFESNLIKSDTLYFTTPEINKNKTFNELYGKTFRYQVIFTNGYSSLILKNATGQIIRANKVE